MPQVFISIGSNIDPEKNIRSALLSLAEKVRIVGISTFYRTPPIDRPEHAAFVNGVAEIETELPPRALKYTVLRGVEDELGRVRTSDKSAPRTVDLDILLYDDLVLREEDLILPDPDIMQRPFLLRGLHELRSDLVLPDSGMRIGDMIESVKNVTISPLPAYTDSLRVLIFGRTQPKRDNEHSG